MNGSAQRNVAASPTGAAPAQEPGPTRQTMKAIVQDHYGSQDVLQLRDIDKPAVGKDDVLVRVHAAGLHIGDRHVKTGLPYMLRVMGFGVLAPKIHVRGMDVAGTVEAVGLNLTRFRAGDQVFGTCDGSFVEYACSLESHSVRRSRPQRLERAGWLIVQRFPISPQRAAFP